MSGQRIVLLMLIVLAVLYAAGASMGLRGGARSGGIGWVEDLSGALTPRMDLEKMQGACLDRQASSFVVLADKPCLVRIQSIKSGTRKMALRLTAGVRIKGQYTAPAAHEKIDKDDESARQTLSLEPGQKISLVILKEGGNLSLSCEGAEGKPCRAEIK
jgi:hypothetical protein